MVTERAVEWRGAEDPNRLESVVVRFLGSGLQAHGTSRTSTWATSWSLSCDEQWNTTRVKIQSVAAEGVATADLRWLSLSRDRAGWKLESSEPQPVDVRELDRALDCDIALCPFTNLMPIRRLGLHQQPHAEVQHLMAWIDVPTLRVSPSVQRYASFRAPDGTMRVRYESEQRDFRADLTLDDDGIVLDYPQIASRVTLS